MDYLSIFGLSENTMIFIKEYQMLISFLFVSFAYLLRSIPMMILAKIKNTIFIHYEVCEVWNQAGPQMYENVSKLIHKHRLEFFSRNFEIARGYTRLGNGKHIFKYNKVFIFADISKLNGKDNDSPGSFETDIKGVIKLTIFRWNRTSLEQLLESCEPNDENNLLCEILNEQDSTSGYLKRDVNVGKKQYCNPDVYKKLDNIVARFQDREWYRQQGRPYKEVIMLYGAPGTGKTSLIRHLTCKYNMLIQIQSSNFALKPGLFTSLLSNRPSIILIEDIDRNPSYLRKEIQQVQMNEEDQSDDLLVKRVSYPSLDNLLNKLDGILQLDNVIVIMTTNNAALLDKALYRLGRVDHLIEMGYLNRELGLEILGLKEGNEIREYLLKDERYNKVNAAMLFNLSNADTISEVDDVLNGNDISLKLSTTFNDQTIN